MTAAVSALAQTSFLGCKNLLIRFRPSTAGSDDNILRCLYDRLNRVYHHCELYVGRESSSQAVSQVRKDAHFLLRCCRQHPLFLTASAQLDFKCTLQVTCEV